QVLLVPYAGLALAALPWIFKDRRVWFGTAAMGLFFLPLLFLPGRLYGAYCYLPFTGLALVWGRAPSLSALLFCLLWIPWNYSHLRKLRSHALFVGEQNRAYVTTLQDFARSTPGIGAFAYDGAPAELHRWGIEGALRYLYPGAHPRLVSVEDRGAEEVMRSQSVALLNWDAQTRRLMILARKADTPDVSYIRMDPRTPLWQLGGGWYRLEGGFRWTQPRATARLQRPATTTEFELTVNIGPDLIREIGGTRVRVRVAGQPAGSREFTRSGWQTVRWPLEPAPAGGVEVEFQVEPEYHPANGDPRRLGIAIGAFGFRP
ncbi:MAG: hypothetical protein HY013_08055, partial [Candidatus Solibacter usitatus]|nr:hypothetical protein [Candidatus Solibacter usitatus]